MKQVGPRALAVCSLFLCAALAAPAFPDDSPTPGPLAQGLELFRQGRRVLAEPLLREGLAAVPDNVEGLLALTRIYLGWSRYEAIQRAEHVGSFNDSLGASVALDGMHVIGGAPYAARMVCWSRPSRPAPEIATGGAQQRDPRGILRQTSAGVERPAAVAPCLQQALAPCQ